jgi:hypothetical protein
MDGVNWFPADISLLHEWNLALKLQELNQVAQDQGLLDVSCGIATVFAALVSTILFLLEGSPRQLIALAIS